MRAIDFWLDNIVAKFITEFAVDTTKSYNAYEQEFLKGLRGRYIRSLYTSIEILLYNKGVMTMSQTTKLFCVHGGRGETLIG
jgi:hypothetical protein